MPPAPALRAFLAPLPTLILGLVSAGQATIAAAVSLLLFIFMIPLVVLYFLFGRRSFQVGDH